MNKNQTRDGLTFQSWLDRVDRILIRKIGLTHRNLADFNSYDCWDSEMSPEEGAEECMAGDDIYSDFVEEF